jgi:CubicO group peptidase (beta-lactamase class C family)
MGRFSRRQLLRGAAALAGTALVSPALAITGRTEARVAAMVEKFRAEHGNPAFSFALGRRGELLYTLAVGKADADNDIDLTIDHRFRIASISKPITASAIMLLVERGRLNLDDRIWGEGGVLTRPYPAFDIVPHLDWVKAITVDHLLTHTCGGWTNDGDDPMFGNRRWDLSMVIVRALNTQPLRNKPGSQYAYSNFGYCLLGRAIEEASGKPYADFVLSEILGPTGAGGMHIGKSRKEDLGDDEVRYLAPDSPQAPYSMNIPRMDSHGGWVASAPELVKFAMAVDGEKTVPDVIAKSSVDTMRRPTAVYSNYGRGWGINTRNRNFGHSGLLTGTTTMLEVQPGGYAFAALTNIRAESEALDKLGWSIHDAVVG